MGSGKTLKAAIKKYGLENFEKTILYCFDSEDKAYLKESEIVTADFIKREDTYNLVLGGIGYNYGKMHPNYGKPSYNKGIPMSNEQKKKLSENHWDCSGAKHPMFGKRHSKESIEKKETVSQRF